jgi:hypothetical protein
VALEFTHESNDESYAGLISKDLRIIFVISLFEELLRIVLEGLAVSGAGLLLVDVQSVEDLHLLHLDLVVALILLLICQDRKMLLVVWTTEIFDVALSIFETTHETRVGLSESLLAVKEIDFLHIDILLHVGGQEADHIFIADFDSHGLVKILGEPINERLLLTEEELRRDSGLCSILCNTLLLKSLKAIFKSGVALLLLLGCQITH